MDRAPVDLAVSDLRQRPEFFDAVAERIWRAWWEHKGASLDSVAGGLRKVIDDEARSFGLVAHVGDRYVGSTLGIPSDLDERPDYSPWVAAVWVEPAQRLGGAGRTLVGHAVQTFFARGVARIYLSSLPLRRNFYVRQGWVAIEENVGAHRQIVYVFDAAGRSN